MQQKFVLITGAAGGIGKACVLQLVSKGFYVFAAVHQPQDGEILQQLAPDQINPITLDVTNAISIQSAQKKILNIVGSQGLYGLINNAGILVSSPIETVPLDQLRLQFEVNTIAVIALIQTFLPLIRIAQGRIINLSSVSGFVAFPFMGSYCASKFALEAITDSLRQELKPWNICVISIQPPFVNTELWQKTLTNAELTKAKSVKAESINVEKSQQFLSETPNGNFLYDNALKRQQQQALRQVKQAILPEQVARVVVHALTIARPQTRYLVGKQAYLGAIAAYLPDRLRDGFIRKQFRLD